MKTKYLLFLLTLFIIWLYLFLYLNRYVIVLSDRSAYKLNRITGKSTFLTPYGERNIKHKKPKLDWKSLEKKKPSTKVIPNLFEEKEKSPKVKK